MGDKIRQEIPQELVELREKKRKRDDLKAKGKLEKRAKLDIQKGETVLSAQVTEMHTYRPRTKGTAAVYEQILALLQNNLGDQSPDVLKGAADEVLACIKAEGILDTQRKEHVEEVIGQISEDYFGQLYRLVKLITDFGDEDDNNNRGALEDQAGVAVVFDEDDEDDNDEWLDNLDEEESEDEEERVKATKVRVEREDHLVMKDERRDVDKSRYDLDITKIDAHWLQRGLGRLPQFKDPSTCVETEKNILDILKIDNLQECENKLVQILQFENFDFAKLLLKNRMRVLYCTMLGQAQDDESKEVVMAEMAEKAPEVVEELERVKGGKRDKEKEHKEAVQKETQKLMEQGKDEKDTTITRIAQDEQKKPSHILDLQALSFSSGGHHMANDKCNLPEGSFRTPHKGYEEIHVKALKAPEIKPEDQVAVSDLPDWMDKAFPAYIPGKPVKLNAIQSKVCDVALNHHEENLLVCAPTGAGKTNVAMLTMLNVLSQYRQPDGTFDTNSFKIVYIAPMKALVQEVVQSFSLRLAPYDLTVRELSGDVSLTKQQIDETNVIVTTPEKWDIVTRKAGDQRAYTSIVRLIIIDEIHLLHDTRGPVLEGVVARTIRQVETTQEHIRLVGLSATLPNFEDVAVFLRVNAERGLFYFGNHFRPVPLEQTYVGITDKKAIKRFNTMNEVTYQKVVDTAGTRNQVLVFVHSRRETGRTARAIRDMALQKDTLGKFLAEDSAVRLLLQQESETIKTAELKELLPYGFAIHHAGLPRVDRKLVEDLYADGHIQVLVSTSTLAWGVNLPAHTVIIKGTQCYMPEQGQWMELSPMDIMQMMGRAGRPQYDKSGHAIIITNHSELQYYLSLNNMQLPIESQLLSSLPDMVNAELVLGTVQTRQDVVNWLGYTYLFVRMLRAPRSYGIGVDEAEEDKLLEQRRVDLAHSALVLLDKNNLIRYDKRTGNVQVTAFGRVASHYYIKYPSISTYFEHLAPTMSDVELLRLFALSNEFKNIPVREEEKVELSKLVEQVPVPVKGGSEEASSKVNVLLQAFVSKLKLDGFALISDMGYIQQSAGRIMRAIFEICLKRSWAGLALRALQWCKIIDKKMWPSQTPLRHFKAVPEDILRRIEKKDFAWERYYDLTSTEIGEFIRVPKIGKTIHKLVHQFPKLDLSAYVQPITRSCLMVELTITPDFQWDNKVHGSSEQFWVLVEDVNGESILHHELFVLKEKQAEEEHTLNFTVAITDPLPPQYFIRVVSDRWINAETLLPVSFRHLILPERNVAHTQLLDLQPLPVTALRDMELEKLFSRQGIKFFNPIQTQCFSTLYNTSDNVLLCAPAAAGKMVCAEFALLNMMKKEGIKRAVYVAPFERLVKERFADWTEKFPDWKISELTGETSQDMKILEASHVVITTPDKWDLLSRRWKLRKTIQDVQLMIVDELHLLDSDSGPTLEAVVSRMRYISVQLRPIRIVAMAASLANAKDVAEWIGCPSSGLFNFSPKVRTVPLELVIHGFDQHHRATRLLAMSRPVYTSIKTYSPEKPVIVFVSDRKQCRLTAVDLLLQAASDDNPKRFLRVSDELMAPHIAGARETALKQTLAFGVGYLHEGFSTSERQVIERLYQAGALQVLVVTESLAWGMSLSAHLVIVADTKKYHGTEKRYVDYPIYDILQMTGRACRPEVDKSGMCVLMCHTSKKEYYKKFIYEPLPVESHLDQRMADHMNAEIVMKTIENKQDAVDWLTWTFYYRRLGQNPNYYGVQGVTHQHLSDHLSEVVENTVEALEQAGCTTILDDADLNTANLGLIASYYYTRYTTIELFHRSLAPTTKRKGLVEILCASSEYDALPMRPGEEPALRGLANQLQVKVDKIDPHTKAILLLNAHFSRSAINTDLAADQKIVLEHAVRLLQALVDVISSCAWLTPALVAMELSQMVVQATTASASPLMQLPHFTPKLVEKAKEAEVEDIFDLMNMEDEDRTGLLKMMSQQELMDIAKACNRYPVISLEYQVANESDLEAGAQTRIHVKLERDSEEMGAVYAPFYPKEKEESWWLVVGQKGKDNTLMAIKRITINKKEVNVKLDVDLPENPGKYALTLYLMSDSYQGCDQEYTIDIKVK